MCRQSQFLLFRQLYLSKARSHFRLSSNNKPYCWTSDIPPASKIQFYFCNNNLFAQASCDCLYKYSKAYFLRSPIKSWNRLNFFCQKIAPLHLLQFQKFFAVYFFFKIFAVNSLRLFQKCLLQKISDKSAVAKIIFITRRWKNFWTFFFNRWI